MAETGVRFVLLDFFSRIIKSVISISFRINKPALSSPKRAKRFNKTESGLHLISELHLGFQRNLWVTMRRYQKEATVQKWIKWRNDDVIITCQKQDILN